jgi:hypothetical protein
MTKLRDSIVGVVRCDDGGMIGQGQEGNQNHELEP